MVKKTRVGIIFGGRSAEHEVSIQSAKNVYDALDKSKYDPVLIGIDRTGKWYIQESSIFSLKAYHDEIKKLSTKNAELSITPGASESHLIASDVQDLESLDVIFPVLHGTYGEDGTMQGMLKLMNIPFVGAGVLGSAVGMDKDVMKKLLTVQGLPVVRYMVALDSEKDSLTYEMVAEVLGETVFIKPANMGSSVGVSKVKNQKEFTKALTHAFEYDRKVLIEEYIPCEEVECSVLGNDAPIASLPGRIIPQHEFYSYEAKYIDENGAKLEIPANIPEEITAKVQELSVQVFKTLYCEGMARVDFFIHKDTQEVYVNEINTIPGFTKISMYPQLWEATGMSYTELVDRLIQLAIERFEKEQKLKTTRH
ncbi:MAG TPA: D-alanine--D-alanine ligase [Candidatus Levybacteria bacterium]|nr:D-alanine--D-alanine ligase [Candidatus Levybacteria bacterium]